MRMILGILGAAVLAACAPSVPDSGPGVGFQDYDEYQRERAAQRQGQGAARPDGSDQAAAAQRQPGAPLSAIAQLDDPPPAGSGAALGSDDEPTAEALARAARDAIGAGDQRARDEADLPLWMSQDSRDDVWATDTASAPSGAVSDQSFEADAPRDPQSETVAERQARLSAEYQMVDPGDLPQHSGDGTPNIVAYALQTSHRVGEQRYRRSPIQFRNHETACAEFASQDLAQEEFLRRGGPERDPLNLDPDGDGFACWWDPEPYRAAARAAAQD